MSKKSQQYTLDAQNRETWLSALVSDLVPLIRSRTGLAPTKPILISCGFPSSGARTKANTGRPGHIGQCHQGPDKHHHHIFIHPELTDAAEIGHVTAHEILHASLPMGVGHRKPFSQAAKRLGLEGKPTATVAGDELAEMIKLITDELGAYPHEKLSYGGGPKQNTRMLKTQCPLCGFIAYTTRKWLDEIGPAVCGQCNVTMLEGTADEIQDPLQAIEQTTEYQIKITLGDLLRRQGRPHNIANRHQSVADPRWAVRMTRKGSELNWWVIDYGDHLLGVVHPRLTRAESREDAIALMEALRDGMTTYDELGVDDDSHLDAEWFDESPDELTDDEPEHPDFEDPTHLDPRFQWERERGIAIEDIDPEAECAKREAWVKE